jgi:hypothetical protein
MCSGSPLLLGMSPKAGRPFTLRSNMSIKAASILGAAHAFLFAFLETPR